MQELALNTDEPLTITQNALKSLENSQKLISKSYLTELGNYDVKLLYGFPAEHINANTDVRIFKVERIVSEHRQSALESLTAAYTALGTAGYNIFLLLKGDGLQTDVYLGVKGQAKASVGEEAGKLLEKVFKGHFSGSKLDKLDGSDVSKLLGDMKYLDSEVSPSITAVTGVPSMSVEQREHFMQGLEHFIDAAEGQVYQALILAEPISNQQLSSIQQGYEGVATQLHPLLKQSLSLGQNESQSVALSISENISTALGKSLSLTETKGINQSLTNTTTHGTNQSTSNTENHGMSESLALGSNKSMNLGASLILSAGTSFSTSKSKTTGTSYSKSQGITQGTSFSQSNGKTEGTSTSSAVGNTQSVTNTQGITSGKTDNVSTGNNRQITFESVDKGIEQILKRVNQQLERVDEARRYGAWNTAAYFIAEGSSTSKALASIFLGLMRGNESNSEDFSLTTWGSSSRQVLPWLANLSHPKLNADFANQLGIAYLTPATLVSGKEMAMQLSLPRRSTSTVSVVETKVFGRRIQNIDSIPINEPEVIELGRIHHLWQDLNQKVSLSLENLTSHVFVTGSTGSGKSNSIYHILANLRNKKIPFLVIEPAKGEYKHVFGNSLDVLVLGTNPKQSQLLKINPFAFPEGIHILEHIDRLIEIFNVCWSMYAAMPAILKEAMLLSYQTAGWDLDESVNQYGNFVFPSFIDLLKALETVLENSAFSQEVKSNYIGSLVTRVKSLTNGLNGQIFSNNEIESNTLFNTNVIIDLSRVGSQETKSLIMGVLIMRLNEYRMSSSNMNQPLKHVTVLEEAHNILKRTSQEQSSEGSNVAGKAVEMLSNAIAEMRTYGEAFIIVDQSPTALDISAIKNTNTKIVMRLPEENDRLLAGKSSGVSQAQIDEIAKLPKGVAVVYQNNWLEPVLCRIHHYSFKEQDYQYDNKNALNLNQKTFNSQIATLLYGKVFRNTLPLDIAMIKQGLATFNLPIQYKLNLKSMILAIESEKEPNIWQEKPVIIANILLSILDIRGDVEKIINESQTHYQFDSYINKLFQNHFISLPKSIADLLYDSIASVWKNLHQIKDDYDRSN